MPQRSGLTSSPVRINLWQNRNRTITNRLDAWSKRIHYENCADVVLNAFVTASCNDSGRSSFESTSIPIGPDYPVFSSEVRKPFTSNSPSPQNLR